MDIKAFGSYYGQTSQLPYCSGFVWTPSDGETSFTTSRALFIESKSSSSKDDLYVRMNDMPGQYIHVENIAGDMELPWAATALSGGSVNGVVVLY